MINYVFRISSGSINPFDKKNKNFLLLNYKKIKLILQKKMNWNKIKYKMNIDIWLNIIKNISNKL